jgi:hypothetical protein
MISISDVHSEKSFIPMISSDVYFQKQLIIFCWLSDEHLCFVSDVHSLKSNILMISSDEGSAGS